jgi:hypothetical protein
MASPPIPNHERKNSAMTARPQTPISDQTADGQALAGVSCSVICPDLSRVRLAEAKARTAHWPEEEAALEMMKVIAEEKRRYGQSIPSHWYGYELSGLWWEWNAKTSKNPEESLQYAANMMALAENLERRPEYYRNRGEMTHWQWFQRGKNNSPNA